MSQIHLENTKNKPKQLRAEVTATNIIESTLQISHIDKIPLDKISILDVAKKSGYSVGAVYRYFKDKNDILSKVYGYYLGKVHKSCEEKLKLFPNTGNVRQLSILIVDHYLGDLRHRNINTVLTLYKVFIQNTSRPEQISNAIDILINPLYNIMKNDKSDTFKQLNHDKIKINLRGLAHMLRSTYLEQNPYWFTSEYRDFLIENCVLLFGKFDH